MLQQGQSGTRSAAESCMHSSRCTNQAIAQRNENGKLHLLQRREGFGCRRLARFSSVSLVLASHPSFCGGVLAGSLILLLYVLVLVARTLLFFVFVFVLSLAPTYRTRSHDPSSRIDLIHVLPINNNCSPAKNTHSNYFTLPFRRLFC